MVNKGVLTVEQEKKLSELIDNAVKLKGLAELLDGYIAKAVLTFIDDKYADQLKEDVKVQLSALIDAVINNDIPLAETLAADVVNKLVDLPGLEEEDEGLIFKGVIEFIVGVVTKWIADKKAAGTNPPAPAPTAEAKAATAEKKAADAARLAGKAKVSNPYTF
jgi:hypothetical protein